MYDIDLSHSESSKLSQDWPGQSSRFTHDRG